MKYYDGKCEICKGERNVRETITISTICPNCKGHGETYWIDEIIKPTIHQGMLHDICHRNIDFLIELIKQEGKKVGEALDVSVREVSAYETQERVFKQKMLMEQMKLKSDGLSKEIKELVTEFKEK